MLFMIVPDVVSTVSTYYSSTSPYVVLIVRLKMGVRSRKNIGSSFVAT